MRGERTGTAGKPRGGNGKPPLSTCQETITKQGDIIPIFAIYFHTRFLLASITIYFTISCITILTDDKNLCHKTYITNNFQFRFDDYRLALSSGTASISSSSLIVFSSFIFVFFDIFLFPLFSLQPSTEM